MIKKILAGVLIILLGSSIVFAGSKPEQEKAAMQAAEAWLKLIDDGKYADSWRETAQSFQAMVTQPQWERSVKAAREPLGKVVSRKNTMAAYTSEVMGAPDGEYVLVQYETVYENKKKTVEFLTVMKEKDGAWKVSGYYIQ